MEISGDTVLMQSMFGALDLVDPQFDIVTP